MSITVSECTAASSAMARSLIAQSSIVVSVQTAMMTYSSTMSSNGATMMTAVVTAIPTV